MLQKVACRYQQEKNINTKAPCLPVYFACTMFHRLSEMKHTYYLIFKKRNLRFRFLFSCAFLKRRAQGAFFAHCFFPPFFWEGFFCESLLFLKGIIWSIWQFVQLKWLTGMSKLPWVSCHPKVYLPSTDFAPKHIYSTQNLEEKFFTLSCPFFQNKKKEQFFCPLQRPFIFFVRVPFFGEKRLPFLCTLFCPFFWFAYFT